MKQIGIRCPLVLTALLLLLGPYGCTKPEQDPATDVADPAAEATVDLRDPREVHLANIRQLTFGGENAEAYFSPDGKSLIFQSARDELECDQMFVLDIASGETRMVSTGQGKTTCGYFLQDGRIVYSSTHLADPACPPPPDYSQGYVWKLYPGFDVFVADADGANVQRITDTPGYDAEATLSPDGNRIIFTSVRDGDLELYTMNTDGSDVRRITDELGYDGGAFYSRDGTRIVWRASRPQTDEDRDSYLALLADASIRPMNLEVYVADADGGNARQVTDNGAGNFAPYFFPDGARILFASNVADPRGRNFDLWMVNDDGSGVEQVTFHDQFDSFPMFSPDGRHLVFASNRNGKQEGETNLFIAEWVD